MSPDAPLISNLSVWENVALIQQYHQGYSGTTAHALTLQHLGMLRCESVAMKRNPELRDEERFRVMLLRAAMMNDVLVIDRPFLIIPNMADAGFMFENLEVLENLFTECFIFDYESHRSKYTTYDTETHRT
ncbi:MAG: hypothetical protein NT072_02580 [Deltaproteobacteria bacterium]|nr:hypothetical protein [Deltaproteobacteria bacterium]